MRTASHELTHFIKRWSPEKYKVLEQYLLTELNRYDNQTVDSLVADQISTAFDNGIELGYSAALDEVVADACEMMLKDSGAIQKLAKRDLSLAQKIKAWIDDFVSSVKKRFMGSLPVHLPGKQPIRL